MTDTVTRADFDALQRTIETILDKHRMATGNALGYFIADVCHSAQMPAGTAKILLEQWQNFAADAGEQRKFDLQSIVERACNAFGQSVATWDDADDPKAGS